MPAYFTTAAALCCCLSSAVAFYLGCPNQQWLRKRPLKFFPGLFISGALVILAYIFFRFELSNLSSIFAVIVTDMLLLGLLPFFGTLKTPAKNAERSNSGLIKSETAVHYQPHWWLRTTGAFLLGYPLAVSISGLIVLLSPGPLTDDVKSQFAMWLITPLWLIPLSLAFFISKVKILLNALLALNCTALALIWLCSKGLN